MMCELVVRRVLKRADQLLVAGLAVVELEPAVIAERLDLAGSDVSIGWEPFVNVLAIVHPVGDPKDALAVFQRASAEILGPFTVDPFDVITRIARILDQVFRGRFGIGCEATLLDEILPALDGQGGGHAEDGNAREFNEKSLQRREH